jgi:hypothetical protein
MSKANLPSSLVSVSSLVFPVQGPSGDATGATDYSSITAQITAATNAGGGTVALQAGIYKINQGLTDSTASIVIAGAGKNLTLIQASTTASGDLMTLGQAFSAIRDITINGNSAHASAGDLLVLNSGYQTVSNVLLENGLANGISVGKAHAALQPKVFALDVQTCTAYGVQIFSGSSTDGQWSDCVIGQSGKSGFVVGAASQQITNVHTWGSGCQSTTDRDGFYVTSSTNHFTNCESETNQGQGWNITGSGATGNNIVGGSSWGNGGNGMQTSASANNGSIIGVDIYDNGTHNTAPASGAAFAGIQNGSTNWTIVGNNSYDNGHAISAGSYNFTASNSYTGRSATYTQTNHYAEVSGADYNIVNGNTMRSEQSYTGVPLIIVGSHTVSIPNQLGAATPPIAPGSPGSVFVSGRWYPQFGAVGTPLATVINSCYSIPFGVNAGHTFAGIGANVTTAGGTGSTIRLAVYTDSAGYPGTLVNDFGTIVSTATGSVIATASLTLTTALYWLVVAPQAGTAPSLQTASPTSTPSPALGILGSGSAGGASTAAGYVAASAASGAMPTNFPTGATITSLGSLPIVQLEG